MATIGGPNTEKDNLVFGYDTGYGVADNTTATRFYPGKPTTNLLTLSGATSLDVRTDIYNNTTKTDLGGGKYKFVNDGTGGSTIRLYTNVNDLVDGSTYGCSVSYENFDPGDGTALFLDWCDQNVTTFSYANYGASNRIFMSGTKSTYNSTYRFLDISLPINSSIVLFDAQVELSTPSPYTDDSRSSTESLIDLKRTKNIDLSNVSFDSTGQPEFDGTDDHIDINPISIDVGNGISYEAVYSAGSNYSTWGEYHYLLRFTGTTHYGLLHEGDSRGWRFDVPSSTGTRTGVTSNSPNATAGAGYYHVLVSYDPVTGGKGYINGEQIGSWSGGYTAFTPSALIIGGQSTSSKLWDGEIPLVKVYNRALSASEIKQNYNAVKNRFGI